MSIEMCGTLETIYFSHTLKLYIEVVGIVECENLLMSRLVIRMKLQLFGKHKHGQFLFTLTVTSSSLLLHAVRLFRHFCRILELSAITNIIVRWGGEL